MFEVFEDAVIDSVKLLPFLFATYFLMEWLEHKADNTTKSIIKRSGRLGPLFGSIIGALPQCGFSAGGSSLYAGRIITLGTLFSIYLSTSDEMLPIMLSSAASPALIGQVIGIKVVIGLVMGFLIDMIFKPELPQIHVHELCSEENCHCRCEESLLRSAFYHTVRVFGFILLISCVLNLALFLIGEERIAHALLDHSVLAAFAASLIGLIPNCAASVLLTQLYLEGMIRLGTMIGGLLTGAGVGLLVLFRVNHKRMKENILIAAGLYAIGCAAGIVLNLIVL
ncbi:MAG: arsenic efflux protein [Lachnospiraceae bacterium]|nr:arsenic efflux protein [Lachnospiraceae bacterium]